MELGTRELVQFISLVATLAGAFAVVKSQLSRVIEDLKNIEAEMHTINDRLDTIESGSAVFKHQVSVLGGILSPSNLDKQSREIAEVKKELTHLREAADRMYKMHNGKHGPVS
jgi:chaperonin cofactor prefoldin